MVSAGCLLTTLIGWWSYCLLFPKTLADHARAVAQALFVGDTRTLYDYTSGDEMRALGWTPPKVNAFYQKLLKPRIARITSRTIESESVNQNATLPSQGIVVVSVNGQPATRSISLAVFVDQTPKGPRTSLIHLLRDAWRIEYYLDHPKADFTPWNNFQARKKKLDIKRISRSCLLCKFLDCSTRSIQAPRSLGRSLSKT